MNYLTPRQKQRPSPHRVINLTLLHLYLEDRKSLPSHSLLKIKSDWKDFQSSFAAANFNFLPKAITFVRRPKMKRDAWVKCCLFSILYIIPEPFFSRLQKVFSALGRKYYIMLTINFCILAICFCTHEYLEQNPILLLNSLMMCLKICEKFFWIIM